MKKWVAMLTALLMLLGLTACGTEPEVTEPETTAPESTAPEISWDLAYDLREYRGFWEIFEEKTEDQWAAMGRYTIGLEGLCTPVTVEMEGWDVLSVTAFGHRSEVNVGQFQGEVNAQIQSVDGAVLVNENCDYDGSTWILTAEGCYEFHPVGDVSTQVYAREDGTLRYRCYWGEYETTFNQQDYAPLYCCTSRDHFLYEAGNVEIVDGEMVLTPVTTVTVSDEYDLDAMFAQAKAEGLFEEYESVDELLAENQSKDHGN